MLQALTISVINYAPLSSLCTTVGYFVLLQVLDSLQTFFLTQPVTILVWLLISAASQSLTCQSQLQRWCLRLEDGLAAYLHTPGITTDVSAEWLKEKCFNFTAFNRNIHYSTVYSAVNRIKPNATCKNDKFSLYLSLLQSYFVHNPFMANIYIIMIYYTTVWQHRHVSEMAPGEGKSNRPYCHPTADSLF